MMRVVYLPFTLEVIWEFAGGPSHFYEALGYRTLKRHLVIDLP